MPTILSESSTFTSTVSVPANGDARTVGSVNVAFQAITNRTKKLRDWLIMLDADEDGDADCLLRPPAGTATADTAPLKLTTGTLNTKAEAGALEFASKKLYFTPDATQLEVSLSDHAHAAAKLRPPAGTASADSSPLKLTAGTNNTKAEAGALEFDGTDLTFTPVATRKTFSFSDHTHATATPPYCEYLYVNNAVSEDFTTTDYVDSALFTTTLSTGAMPLASTDYVVELAANIKTGAVDGGAYFTAAKTIASSVSEIPGCGRTIQSLSTSLSMTVPINAMFQANSNDIPIIVSIQGKVDTSGTVSIGSGSNFFVKVAAGTVAVTGKGSPA